MISLTKKAWSHLVPLTKKQLNKWIAYTAAKGAYCSECGAKFSDNQQWGYLFTNRLYPICTACALDEAKPVVPPAQLRSFIHSHGWKSNCRGMALELLNGETFSVKEPEALALLKRLRRVACDICSGDSPQVVGIGIDQHRFLLLMCQACVTADAPIALDRFEVSAHLADIATGRRLSEN